MTYTCPLCRWYLGEPDPSEYPDTEQGQDALAADYAYFELQKEKHNCRCQLIETVAVLYEDNLPF